MGMFGRLLRMLVQRHVDNLPPLPQPGPAPRVTTTSRAERDLIDQRLSGISARVAVLLAEVGLDERRTRDKGTRGDAL